MKNCIIITPYIEGDIKNIIAAMQDAFASSFIICADSGFDQSRRAGITPDLIIGDYDSLEGDLPPETEHITFPVHKDYTDTGLCLDWALEHGYRDAVIIGGLGGRLDHTIANIQDIAGFTQKGMNIRIRDEKNFATVLYGPADIAVRADILSGSEAPVLGEKGPRIGLFSLTDTVFGINSKGLEYPLTDGELHNTFPLGAGNPFTCHEAEISIEKGLLLVTFSRFD